MVDELLVAVQDHAAALEISHFLKVEKKVLNLGSISKLVSVGRDTRHARDTKIEWIKFQSNLFCEHNQESSKARVYMDWKVEAEAERGDLRDRVHDPVRVLGRAHEKRDGVSIASTFHVTDTRSLRDRVHRHVSHVYPYTPSLEHFEQDQKSIRAAYTQLIRPMRS